LNSAGEIRPRHAVKSVSKSRAEVLKSAADQIRKRGFANDPSKQ
jgi:hypothetical protein